MLRPYNGSEPKGSKGIAPRPGMESWHDAECSMELKYARPARRGYWCETHGQWAYERPVSITYTWADEITEEVPT